MNVDQCVFEKTHEDLKCDLGNRLCEYFARMGQAFVNEIDFSINNDEFNLIFLRDLPRTVLCEKGDKNLLKFLRGIEFHNMYSLWELNSNFRYLFWLFMKPKINSILTEVIKQNRLVKTITFPVIHFRCSDVPFIRHSVYHFQKYSFFTDSLEELSQKGIDTSTVYLMFYFNHSNEHRQHLCQIYLNSLKSHIERCGYNVILVNTMSSLDDFSILFHAPAVISTCSSFSFFAGFFNNGLFITEGHYSEDVQLENTSCAGDCLRKGYSLNHREVQDYDDTETVIKQLS